MYRGMAGYGITINMLGLQNEPYNNSSGWETCDMPPATEALLFNDVHTALTAAGLSTKLMVYDHNKGMSDGEDGAVLEPQAYVEAA